MIKDYKQFFESIQPHQKDMYDGIVDILLQVKYLKNRAEIAENMMKDFKKEEIEVDDFKFLKDCEIVDSKGNFIV